VAIVEINNENSLLQLKVAFLPEYYRAEVVRKWHNWLQARYGSTDKLVAAWGGNVELGPNLLPPRPTFQGGQFFAVTNGPAGETRVTVLKVPEVSWHAQLHWGGLTLEEGQLYTVEFSARSDQPRRLALSTRLNKADWHNCGLAEDADLGPQWKTFSHVFRPSRVEPGAVRLDMVVGSGPVGGFAIKDLTLRRGGSLGLKPGESLEARNIEPPSRTQSSPRGLAWTRFLAETERAYTDGMRAFLKKDLGVKAAIIDTQASYGGIAGTYRESFNDFIDMHAYWQHPSFPGRPWDGANWTIRNTPMVDDKSGGNLARLAAYRLAGKPYTVSEYDHPAPSHYSAEMFPMMASFAAFQDWDGFFQFDWGGTEFDSGRIRGYFAMQQHPAKLAFMPAAALMFRRGDVPTARGLARLSIPVGQVEEFTADNLSMNEAWQRAGLKTADLLQQRLEVRFAATEKLALETKPASGSPLAWDPEAGLYTVDAPAAKAVVGRCTVRTTSLNGAEFDVRSNPKNFAAISLNAVDGQPLANSKRLLLAAIGKVENTGMRWNGDYTSVSTNWGTAPTLCEGIAAKVVMATSARRLKVYALGGDGARATEIPVTLSAGKLAFDIGPQFKTLWYEIVSE
jgi:hypothetical protein